MSTHVENTRQQEGGSLTWGSGRLRRHDQRAAVHEVNGKSLKDRRADLEGTCCGAWYSKSAPLASLGEPAHIAPLGPLGPTGTHLPPPPCTHLAPRGHSQTHTQTHATTPTPTPTDRHKHTHTHTRPHRQTHKNAPTPTQTSGVTRPVSSLYIERLP